MTRGRDDDAAVPGSGIPARAAMQPWVTRGIAATAVVVYIVQATLLASGAVESVLGFTTQDLGHHWWTLLTFTIAHGALWPLTVNLAVLLVFGTRLERNWGSGAFLRFYLACSMGAWVAHLVWASADLVLAGAAGPAMGILLAFASMSGGGPSLRVGAVSVSPGWLVVGGTMLIIAVGVAAAPPGAASAFLAHVGGFVGAWAYLRTAGSLSLKRIRDGVSPVPDDYDEMPRAVPRTHLRDDARLRRHEDDVVARSNAVVAHELAARRTEGAEPRDAACLNRLLDKISAQGLESLTPDERVRLDEASRRLRGK
ncbi:MAG: rhomboid family intramembrane serine protease [Gemmatimonadaceae bacterium]|nr:rhomboid family intramembrane serine protease [Gemmatimonadaceae bacterium]